jgi:hypothetical protein
MARVNELYKSFFEGKLQTLLHEGHREQETILHYLRIYTHLLSAFNLLRKESLPRCFDHLTIVSNLTRNLPYPKEAHYFRYINSIAREILANRAAITKTIRQEESTDPSHAVTKNLMAQNICVLRILKIGKSV